MTWNYRIIRHKDPASETGEYYAIHEVFYDDIDNGVTITESLSVTQEPVALHGESMDDLLRNLEQQKQAFTRATLNFEDF